MREVFEHHRLGEHARRGVDDAVDRRPFHAQLGERLVHPTVEGDLVVLLGHELAVHGLGDLDEPDPPMQHDQRKPEFLGGGAGLAGQCGDLRADLHDHPDGTGFGQSTQVEPWRAGECGAGGQHELAAL